MCKTQRGKKARSTRFAHNRSKPQRNWSEIKGNNNHVIYTNTWRDGRKRAAAASTADTPPQADALPGKRFGALVLMRVALLLLGGLCLSATLQRSSGMKSRFVKDVDADKLAKVRGIGSGKVILDAPPFFKPNALPSRSAARRNGKRKKMRTGMRTRTTGSRRRSRRRTWSSIPPIRPRL